MLQVTDRIRRSLSLQLILVVILVTVIALGLSGWYRYEQQSAAMEVRLNEELEITANSLAASLSVAIFNYDDRAVETICQAAMSRPEVVSVTIDNVKDVDLVYAKNEHGDINISARRAGLPGDLWSRKEIMYGGKSLGAVNIGVTERLMAATLRQTLKSIFIQAFLLEAILVIPLVLLLRYRFIIPVHRLTRATSRIAQGDRDYAFVKHGRDELGDLARAFMEMQDSIYRTIDSLNQEMEDRKQAEQDRDRLEEQLRQAQKMEAVGQLAGGIAHDFNNILTAIMGNAELLKMGLPQAADQIRHADEVIKGAARAADLTGQLLAFARKGKRQVLPVDIHDVVTQTVNMLTHTIDRRIEIRLELHASPSTVMGDPTQLHGALLNLGVNARDAMPGGGILTYTTRNVALTVDDCIEHPFELTPGDFLEIGISDTGVGMDKKTRKRIFEPFFTTKEVGKGTGLGLAGVYGCVRGHDGSIRVYSEPGRGATFRVLLPQADAAAEAEPQNIAENVLEKGSGRVLVVDDEESVRDFVQTSLQHLGYTVSACKDGLDGVEYYRRHHREINLVILDLIMPRMNGQDAFREMKIINPNVRVLVSSGFSHTTATRQMLGNGALALLNKPFQITELAQAVAEYV